MTQQAKIPTATLPRMAIELRLKENSLISAHNLSAVFETKLPVVRAALAKITHKEKNGTTKLYRFGDVLEQGLLEARDPRESMFSSELAVWFDVPMDYMRKVLYGVNSEVATTFSNLDGVRQPCLQWNVCAVRQALANLEKSNDTTS